MRPEGAPGGSGNTPSLPFPSSVSLTSTSSGKTGNRSSSMSDSMDLRSRVDRGTTFSRSVAEYCQVTRSRASTSLIATFQRRSESRAPAAAAGEVTPPPLPLVAVLVVHGVGVVDPLATLAALGCGSCATLIATGKRSSLGHLSFARTHCPHHSRSSSVSHRRYAWSTRPKAPSPRT